MVGEGYREVQVKPPSAHERAPGAPADSRSTLERLRAYVHGDARAMGSPRRPMSVGGRERPTLESLRRAVSTYRQTDYGRPDEALVGAEGTQRSDLADVATALLPAADTDTPIVGGDRRPLAAARGATILPRAAMRLAGSERAEQDAQAARETAAQAPLTYAAGAALPGVLTAGALAPETVGGALAAGAAEGALMGGADAAADSAAATGSDEYAAEIGSGALVGGLMGGAAGGTTAGAGRALRGVADAADGGQLARGAEALREMGPGGHGGGLGGAFGGLAAAGHMAGEAFSAAHAGIGALAGMGAMAVGRRYGPRLGAAALERMIPRLQAGSPGMRRAAAMLQQAAARGRPALDSTYALLAMRDPEVRAAAQAAEEETDAH
jgi:hypothetical protein